MMNQQDTVGAIIVAAGQSTRMGEVDKVLALIEGRPILAWTLEAFVRSAQIDRVVAVLREDQLVAGAEIVRAEGWSDRVTLCPGGDRRQDSVAAGLAALGECGWVLVHDGARPCVDGDLIAATLSAARETGAALPALPLSDTLKQVDGNGLVVRTVPRDGLWAAQTPQAFRYAILSAAYEGVQDDVTDDGALVERLGVPVRIVPGSPDNLKVTHPGDLGRVAVVLRFRAPLAG